jgi:hypothetical protein
MSDTTRPYRVILAGNVRQAKEFLREQDWNPRECIVVGVPHALRGLRGPVEVHRVGTYYEDRSEAFRTEVEQSLAVIAATSKGSS